MNFVSESLSAWGRIAAAAAQGQPVVIYGTGNGADKIIDFCERKHIAVAGIFASDGFCHGKLFRGIRVESYGDITARLGRDFLLVIGFASELPEVLNRFRELDKLHPTVAPHLGLYCEENLDGAWLEHYEGELRAAHALLGDELSRKVFLDMLNYKFSGRLHYLFDHATKRKDDLRLLQLTERETYYDLGAYDGDTVKEFLQATDNRYSHIAAVEPDAKNFSKLQLFAAALDPTKVTTVNAAIWHEEGNIAFTNQSGRAAHISTGQKSVPVAATTIDRLSAVTSTFPSYIKMDLEGCEKEALQGGAVTIRRHKPKLLLAGYHYNEDLFRIPLILKKLRPDYQIFLRKHPYVPDWEINFLAI
ncbi:MAG: FkbM family methyltransferase [Acidaminococcaceae bacterium]|nr:FkbM family methyltransferase [Acidaminococcaceae bacterium]